MANFPIFVAKVGKIWEFKWRFSAMPDNYRDLRDTIVNPDGDPRNVGQKVILPATFCGGPRYMFERQKDAMSYIRKSGRPDLSIKVTTNPKWPEILESLTPGQQPHDRPDLLVRVFCLEIQKFLQILKDVCFGCLVACSTVLNFKNIGFFLKDLPIQKHVAVKVTFRLRRAI